MVIVGLSFLITLPFHGFLLLLDQLIISLLFIYIWSWQGYLLGYNIIKHCIYSFTNLMVFEISLLSIFEY